MKDSTADELVKWTIEPFGWAIALLTGVWAAFAGIGNYIGAEMVLGLELVATLMFLSYRFKPRFRSPIRETLPFLVSAAAALVFYASLFAGTIGAQARANADARDRKQAMDNSTVQAENLIVQAENLKLQTQNVNKLNAALEKAASDNEHVILVSNVVVCTQPSPINDCDYVDSNQVKTFPLIPPDLKAGQKVVNTWAVPIDNMKDLVAFQSVTAVIDPVQKNVVNLTALRSQPPMPGRVRYAVYATVNDPILFPTK